jgi:hypothetical protein
VDAGRVEHLISRQTTWFQSLEALLAFVSRVLREVRDAHAAPESRPLVQWPRVFVLGEFKDRQLWLARPANGWQ